MLRRRLTHSLRILIAFANLTSKPTTLAGYGITDAQSTITTGTTAQYFRGDLSLATFPTTTAAFSASANKNFVTDAQLTVIGNTSGTNTGDQTTVSGNAGTATALQNSRSIYGNPFNGTADLAQIIASTFGGTGNGFTKFTGPATSEKTFTLPNASSTIAVTSNDLSVFASTTSSQIKGVISDETGSGALAFATSPSLITPDIGVATGTSLAATGAITSSGTAGIGYATGAGGAVTQATSKSTGVTLNKICGTITMNNAALAAATIVTFTVTNSTVAATDVIYVQHDNTGTTGAYTISANTSAAGSFKISVRNNTAGSLSEAIVLRYVVIKAVVN
jgi:hypothetical protein